MMLNINSLNYTDADFYQQLDTLLAWEASIDGDVAKIVADILANVKKRGNAAVLEYTNKFDRMNLSDAKDLEVTQSQLQSALEFIDAEQRQALETAAQRIRHYAQHQKMESWSYTEDDGTVLGQNITAMDRVGLYVPGGKAAYPSSVLMNAIPAKVAGVPELIMVVPTPDGEVNQLVLAAAAVAGVDREIGRAHV